MKEISKHSLVSVLFLCWLLTVWTNGFSIACITSTGRDVSTADSFQRDIVFDYHNNTDDQHWYGTNKWAVKFDFRDVFPSYDDTRFTINQAVIYLPLAAGNVTAELKADAGGSPSLNTTLATVTAPTTAGWNQLPFTTSVTDTVCWLVITKATTANGPLISASRGDGTHSYFLNSSAPEPYFQNMAAAGYQSEFLFGVRGAFVIDGFDVQLLNVSLQPEVAINSMVSPTFTIVNHSDSTLTQVNVNIAITSPNPFFSIQDVIQITQPIQPHTEYTVLPRDPAYPGHEYTLPAYPTQIKLSAAVTTEYTAIDPISDNSATLYYNCFDEAFPTYIMENFLRSDQAENLYTAQESVPQAEMTILNYFPLVIDDYYQLGANQRYSWYDLIGLPMVVLGGTDYVTGYFTNYADTLLVKTNDLLRQKTFVQMSDCTMQTDSLYTQLRAKITLRNATTYMFDSATEPSLVRQSRFYSALFRREIIEDREHLVFDRWGSYQDTLLTALGINQLWRKSFNISLQDIAADSLYLSDNYVLVLWLQHNTTQQIIFSYATPVSIEVGNSDQFEHCPPLSLHTFPNPLPAGRALQMKILPQPAGKVEYSLFNLKGQRVRAGTFSTRETDYWIDMSTLQTSGVYLLKAIVADAKQPDRKQTITTKILILK